MSGSHDPTLAAVAGFLLGGVVVDTFTDLASLLIAGGTLGGMVGAIFGALLADADPERAAGAGGAVGLAAAIAVFVIDSLSKG